MKKILFAAVAVLAFGISNAQETKFGVKAGVDFASTKYDFGVGEVTGSDTGFYVGGFASIGVSESFAVQPELWYVALPDDFSYLSVPVMAKFTFAEKFSIMAGPDLNYFLNAEEDEFKVNIGVGASYAITENLCIDAKYSIGTGDVAVSGLFVGVGYKF